MVASSETRFVSVSKDVESELPSSLPAGLRGGLVIGAKYELIRQLGIGSMGEVWAARHRTLDEEVAIKIVRLSFDASDETSSASRFLLEARVAASLSRKTRHIVSVTDHGEDRMLSYLVMELLPGKPLDAWLAEHGPMSVEEVTPFIVQLARGLEIAHTDGVVHRDLKPSNVFVSTDEDGRALLKILDFGIAKLRSPVDTRSPHSTARGFLLGTPAYMSPEQARGKPLDHRCDVWALGVLSYHLLTAKFPFEGDTPEELFARLCRFEPTPILERRPELPSLVGDIFARAFSENIDERYGSALAFAAAFERVVARAKNLKTTPHAFPVSSALMARESFPGSAAIVSRANSKPASGGSDTPGAPAVSRQPTKSDPLVISGIPSRRPSHLLPALLLLLGLGGLAAVLVWFATLHTTERTVAVALRPAPSVLTSSSAEIFDLSEDVPPPEARNATTAIVTPVVRPPSSTVETRTTSTGSSAKSSRSSKPRPAHDKSEVF